MQTFTIVTVFPIEGIYFVPTWAAVILVLSIAISAVYWSLPWLLSLRGVEMRRRSLFGTMLIFESEDEDGTPVRLLNVDGTFQSASYISDDLWSELVCEYHRTMADAIDEMGMARSVLVIGGGGYSLPKYLITHTRRMRVTVVEIDPRITQVARERFFLDRVEQMAEGRIETVNGDGWKYLRECGRSFDVIVNDAFSGAKPLGAKCNKVLRVLNGSDPPGCLHFDFSRASITHQLHIISCCATFRKTSGGLDEVSTTFRYDVTKTQFLFFR